MEEGEQSIKDITELQQISNNSIVKLQQKQSSPSNSLMDLELDYTKEELEAYTKQRLKGVAKKTQDWIKRASRTLWEQTEGVISYETMSNLREYTLNKWKSENSWGKVLNFAKSFLEHLAKLRLDSRYLNFSIFLDKPKARKKEKMVTNRVITEKDVQNVVKFFVKKWKTGKMDRETIRKKQSKERMFEYGSMENQLKRTKIELEHSALIDNPKERHFVIGDLRKFAEQMADKIKWDVSNKNYILTHGVASVDWSRYKHPLPEFVYKIYMESWKDVHLVPKEAYELLRTK